MRKENKYLKELAHPGLVVVFLVINGNSLNKNGFTLDL